MSVPLRSTKKHGSGISRRELYQRCRSTPTATVAANGHDDETVRASNVQGSDGLDTIMEGFEFPPIDATDKMIELVAKYIKDPSESDATIWFDFGRNVSENDLLAWEAFKRDSSEEEIAVVMRQAKGEARNRERENDNSQHKLSAYLYEDRRCEETKNQQEQGSEIVLASEEEAGEKNERSTVVEPPSPNSASKNMIAVQDYPTGDDLSPEDFTPLFSGTTTEENREQPNQNLLGENAETSSYKSISQTSYSLESDHATPSDTGATIGETTNGQDSVDTYSI